MLNLYGLLLSTTVAPWISTLFPILRIAFIIILILCSLSIIALVLIQDETAMGGTNAISGASESFYSQNKGNTREGRLKRLTIILAATILLITILYFLSFIIYAG